jgi:hypothetical protein
VHIRLRVFHLGQPWFARRIAVALELQRANRRHPMLPMGDASSHLYEVSGKSLGNPATLRSLWPNMQRCVSSWKGSSVGWKAKIEPV